MAAVTSIAGHNTNSVRQRDKGLTFALLLSHAWPYSNALVQLLTTFSLLLLFHRLLDSLFSKHFSCPFSCCRVSLKCHPSSLSYSPRGGGGGGGARPSSPRPSSWG